MNTATAAPESDLKALITKPEPDEGALQARAQRWLTMVENMPVETQQDYDLALGEVRSIKGAWDAMEAERTGFTGPLNALLTRLNGKFQPRLKLLKTAEDTLKAKMAEFIRKQEAIAAEARRKAEEAAAAERRRLEEQAAEQRRKAQEEADALLAAAKGKKATAAAQEAAAATLQAAEAQAGALEATAAVVIAQPVITAPAKGRGISTPKTIEFEVENTLELVKFIANERPDLIYLLEVAEPKMRAQVKLQGLATKLPGVKVFEKTSVRVR